MTDIEGLQPTMYIIVNNDLGMSKGKIASQVGHVVEKITQLVLLSQISYQTYKDYCNSGHKKIILKGDEKTLRYFLEHHSKTCIQIIDAGLTEIPPDSLTVIGFMPSATNKELFSGLKLL